MPRNLPVPDQQLLLSIVAGCATLPEPARTALTVAAQVVGDHDDLLENVLVALFPELPSRPTEVGEESPAGRGVHGRLLGSLAGLVEDPAASVLRVAAREEGSFMAEVLKRFMIARAQRLAETDSK